MRVCIIAGCLLSAGSGWLNAAGPSGGASVRSVVRTDPQRRLVRQVALVPAPGSTRNDALAELGMSRADIDKLIHRLAAENQLDPALVQAVVRVESDYDPFAVSPKGARGLMQLMPQTARGLAVRNSFSPIQNIEGGVRHLKALMVRFEGDTEKALAAYNAGAGAVQKHGGVPPYRETTEYVAKVGRKWKEARERAVKSTPERPPRLHPVLVTFEDAQGRLHVRTAAEP
jgi:soluble lytic murein transglycosylase-like protein